MWKSCSTIPDSSFISASTASAGADSTLFIVLGTVLGCCFIAVAVFTVVICKRRQVCPHRLHHLAPAFSCLCRNLDPDVVCWRGTLFHPDLHDCEHDTGTSSSFEITLQPCTHNFVALQFSEHLHVHDCAPSVRFCDHVMIYIFDPDVSLQEVGDLRMSAGNGILSWLKTWSLFFFLFTLKKKAERTLVY